MDENSRDLARSVPGTVLSDGTRRPYARLNSIFAEISADRSTGTLRTIYFQFQGIVLEVSSDDEFFTGDRVHLKSIPALSDEVLAKCTNLSALSDFSQLIGLDLNTISWCLRAGFIDQYVVFEFIEHKSNENKSAGEITILGDDFHLFLFKGAPKFPNIAFDPDTLACRSI
jgi:hypothetical protein